MGKEVDQYCWMMLLALVQRSDWQTVCMRVTQWTAVTLRMWALCVNHVSPITASFYGHLLLPLCTMYQILVGMER